MYLNWLSVKSEIWRRSHTMETKTMKLTIKRLGCRFETTWSCHYAYWNVLISFIHNIEKMVRCFKNLAVQHPCRSAISIKLLCNFIEIALRHGCYAATFLKYVRLFSILCMKWSILLPISCHQQCISWCKWKPVDSLLALLTH